MHRFKKCFQKQYLFTELKYWLQELLEAEKDRLFNRTRMSKKVTAPPPTDLDFTIVYNKTEFKVSKFKVAIYSQKIRKIPNFVNCTRFECTGIASIANFGAFVKAVQGNPLEITASNALDLVQLADEWEVDSLRSECRKFISDNTDLEAIFNRLKETSTESLESVISSHLDVALALPSFEDFSIEVLSRILGSKDRVLSNHHLLYKFVMKMYERYGDRAEPLIAAVDIRLLTSDEALQILKLPCLVKGASNQMTVSLLTESKDLKKQVSENNTMLSQIMERLEKLEQTTARFHEARNEFMKKTSEALDKLSNNSASGQPGVVSCEKKIEGLEAKINQAVKELRESSSQKIAELEGKTQKDLKKTQTTVASLTKRLSSLETKCEALQSEASEMTRQATDAANSVPGQRSITTSSAESEAVPYENLESVGILEKLGKEAKGNVHEKGVVEITASSTDHGLCFKVGDRDWDDFWFSGNKPDQWICFDFKNRRVRVTDYRIKTHKFSSYSCHLKEWKLQGSDNQSEWVDLDTRDTDSLNESRKVEHFVCSGKGGSFRFIRLLSTGPNHRGDYLMALTNIDFFGSIE